MRNVSTLDSGSSYEKSPVGFITSDEARTDSQAENQQVVSDVIPDAPHAASGSEVSVREYARLAELVPVVCIRPSPENDDIYGEIDLGNPDLVDLGRDIARDGIRVPLQVSSDGFIVSGHRRYAAANMVELAEVPVVYLDIKWSDYDEHGWKKILRSHNHQRVKSKAVRLREMALDIDPELAHRQLIEEREKRSQDAPPSIIITGEKIRAGFSDRKQEFLDAAIQVIDDLQKYWPLSVRQVHYGLLNDPPLRNSSDGKQRARYANDQKSYKALCDLLARARLNGAIPFHAITDSTRPRSGTYFHADVATFAGIDIENLFHGFRRDLLQSQADHVELIVEKLTVQNIVQPVANRYCLPMTVGRGYCSIDPRYELAQRYRQSGKDRLILLIASDFDPDGEEIAESFARSMRDDFDIDERSLVAHKILLREDQISDWSLPPNRMEAKVTSAQYKKFMKRYCANEVYELEAVPPEQMQSAIVQAIESVIDLDAFNAEIVSEKSDAVTLQAMKREASEAFRDMFQNEGLA